MCRPLQKEQFPYSQASGPTPIKGCSYLCLLVDPSIPLVHSPICWRSDACLSSASMLLHRSNVCQVAKMSKFWISRDHMTVIALFTIHWKLGESGCWVASLPLPSKREEEGKWEGQKEKGREEKGGEKWDLCEEEDVLISLSMVKILQFISRC